MTKLFDIPKTSRQLCKGVTLREFLERGTMGVVTDYVTGVNDPATLGAFQFSATLTWFEVNMPDLSPKEMMEQVARAVYNA